ncbi:MAG TPA: hypothetical protein VM580_04955, partial [Labilithrix sp.]|nr:hypothetical protein [Labilithrix sp.]
MAAKPRVGDLERLTVMEIPSVKNTDAEDVVWGLQTADTLWKRGERIDALVWLRRAAQAAGDANDDDRALELARYAAELTEWMARAENSVGDDAPEDDAEALEEVEEVAIEMDADAPDDLVPLQASLPDVSTIAPPAVRFPLRTGGAGQALLGSSDPGASSADPSVLT